MKTTWVLSVQTVLKTSLVLGVGIGLGMRIQRVRAHAMRF